jgi:membrane protein YqaA with SNARE-associated domain
VPSEIVIPPAAFLATEGKLNTFGVIAAGTFGSWLGATATYWAALWLGRVFIARWGRYFLLSEHKLERAERLGSSLRSRGHFLCAPFASDPPCHFYSCWNHSDEFRHIQRNDPGRRRRLWCSVLAWFGQKVLTREMVESKDATALIKAVKESGNFHAIVIACVVITVLYLVWSV